MSDSMSSEFRTVWHDKWEWVGLSMSVCLCVSEWLRKWERAICLSFHALMDGFSLKLNKTKRDDFLLFRSFFLSHSLALALSLSLFLPLPTQFDQALVFGRSNLTVASCCFFRETVRRALWKRQKYAKLVWKCFFFDFVWGAWKRSLVNGLSQVIASFPVHKWSIGARKCHQVALVSAYRQQQQKWDFQNNCVCVLCGCECVHIYYCLIFGQ